MTFLLIPLVRHGLARRDRERVRKKARALVSREADDYVGGGGGGGGGSPR